MEQPILGNPDGWFQAWTSVLAWISEHNPTPIHPVLIVAILTDIAILGGCWWIYTTYIRTKANAGAHGGH